MSLSGNREPALTRWEAEFYSYIASQHRQISSSRNPKAAGSSLHTSSGTGDGDSGEDSMSTASIDTTESERGVVDDAATRRARAKSVRPEPPVGAPVVPAAPATRPLSRGRDSVDSAYFNDLGSYSFDIGDQSDHEREGKEESSSHFSVSSEDLDQSTGVPVQAAAAASVSQAMPPSMLSTQFSTTSHFDLGDYADSYDSGSGEESEGGSGSDGEGDSDDDNGEDGSDGDDGDDVEVSSEDSFGASKPSPSKPQSAASGNLVHASVIRAGSPSNNRSEPRRASQSPHRQRSDTVGFDDDLDDAEVDYSLPGDSDGEGNDEEEMPSPPSSAGGSAGTSAFVSRAPSGIPSMVSSPEVSHPAGKPPLGSSSAERTAPAAAPVLVEKVGQTRSRSYSSPQSIDLGDPTQEHGDLRFDQPVVSNDTREHSGEGRGRGESIALSIDIHDSDDDDVISSMSEGDMVQAPAAKTGIANVKQRVLSSKKKKQDKDDDDAASVDYSLPSDD